MFVSSMFSQSDLGSDIQLGSAVFSILTKYGE